MSIHQFAFFDRLGINFHFGYYIDFVLLQSLAYQSLCRGRIGVWLEKEERRIAEGGRRRCAVTRRGVGSRRDAARHELQQYHPTEET